MASKSKTDESPQDEEKIALDSAIKIVKQEGYLMKRALDDHKLTDALKHALNMLCELRTSLLRPKNYYVLYMEAADELRFLETYLLEEKHEKRMAELYELVQYAGNILPRLYLLITVGSAYIKLKEAPAKDVLRDIVEMCRGIQHPTRGLFLRTYLLEMMKDKLPDVGSEYEGRGGSVSDSIEFILQNFIEMNKLWVRMQHQGPARDRERREIERSELRLLVGKNIARLSQLDGVDLLIYSENVLPRLMEQTINCRDPIAQQYLMECVIQVFPDEYHLRNLKAVLQTCGKLQPSVNIKAILVSLIDRLANYASNDENSIPEDIPVFQIFSSQIHEVVESQKQMPLRDVLALYASLLNLSIICYPKEVSNVDEIFQFCGDFLSQSKEGENKEECTESACVQQIIKLLNTPPETYKDILVVLRLQHYAKLMTFLSFNERKKVAINIAKATIEHCTSIQDSENVDKLLNFVAPLIKDQEDQPEEVDEEEFEEEQNLVASLVHTFNSEDLEEQFGMYIAARKHFYEGGEKRIKHTLTPLIVGALKLAIRLKETQNEDEKWQGKVKKVFKFVHETMTTFSKNTKLPQISLHLYLQCAQAADKCGSAFEDIAYEFMTQAFVIYEEQITDSQTQFQSICLIIATLQHTSVFGEDNYDTLVTKTAQYSFKLLKKPDQCRAVYMCSHLFWQINREKEFKNEKRVFECLQKSLKIADSGMDSSMNVPLFVEIFNEYLYYFENDCEAVSVDYLNNLKQLIINAAEGENPLNNAHYQNTLRYIELKKETDEVYKQIE